MKKQFSLEEYLANPNQRVETRDGRPVRIICTDKKYGRRIIALLGSDDGDEGIKLYNDDGTWTNGLSRCDLVFVTDDPKPAKSPWISAKDKLPKEEEWVFTCCKVDNISTCIGVGYVYKGIWFDGEDRRTTIDYWMEAPDFCEEK